MRTVEIDSQVLTALMTCQELWNLKFLQHWRSNQVKEAFEKGDLGHTACKVYYEGIKVHQDAGLEKIDKLDLIRQAIESMRALVPEQSLPLEEAERIVRIIEGYFHHYLETDDMRILAVEKPFSYILYENAEEDLRIVLTGIIDLLFESKLSGRTVMDHKTQGSDYQLQHRNNQFIGYATAFDSNWVIGNRIGLQLREPKHGRYRRQTLSISDALKSQWKEQVIKSVRRAIQAYESKQFEMNFSWCPVYGGCEFSQICDVRHDPEAHKYLLMRDFYKGQPWSPYNRH